MNWLWASVTVSYQKRSTVSWVALEVALYPPLSILVRYFWASGFISIREFIKILMYIYWIYIYDIYIYIYLSWQEAERSVIIHPKQKKVQWNFIHMHKCMAVVKTESDSSQRCPASVDKIQWTQSEIEENFIIVRSVTDCPEMLWSFHPLRYSKLYGTSFLATYYRWPCSR